MTWQEEVQKRYGLVRSGELQELSSLKGSYADGAEIRQLFPTTPVETPTENQNILICTSPSACHYARSVISPCIKDCTCAQAVLNTTPDTMSVGLAFHQKIKKDEMPVKLNGERYGEIKTRKGEMPIKRFTVRSRNGGKINPDGERIVELWNSGMTATNISKELGISYSTVRGVVRRRRDKYGKTQES
jgi:hypothetical protein